MIIRNDDWAPWISPENEFDKKVLNAVIVGLTALYSELGLPLGRESQQYRGRSIPLEDYIALLSKIGTDSDDTNPETQEPLQNSSLN